MKAQTQGKCYTSRGLFFLQGFCFFLPCYTRGKRRELFFFFAYRVRAHWVLGFHVYFYFVFMPALFDYPSKCLPNHH